MKHTDKKTVSELALEELIELQTDSHDNNIPSTKLKALLLPKAKKRRRK